MLTLALAGSPAAFLVCQLTCAAPGVHVHHQADAAGSGHAPWHSVDAAPDGGAVSSGLLCRYPAVLDAARDRAPASVVDSLAPPDVPSPGLAPSSTKLALKLSGAESPPHSSISLPLLI